MNYNFAFGIRVTECFVALLTNATILRNSNLGTDLEKSHLHSISFVDADSDISNDCNNNNCNKMNLAEVTH